MNFVALKDESAKGGIFANYYPQSSELSQQVQKVSYYACSWGYYAVNPSDSISWIYNFPTAGTQRTYGGGVSMRLDSSYDSLDFSYLMDLDKSEIKVCKPSKSSFKLTERFNELFNECDMTSLTTNITKSQYVTDVNMRGDVVGTYTYVDRSTGESSNGLFNLKNVPLPQMDLKDYRVAANYGHLFYIKKSPSSSPIIQILGRNNLDQIKTHKKKKSRENLMENDPSSIALLIQHLDYQDWMQDRDSKESVVE